jgi:hypothetical protein
MIVREDEADGPQPKRLFHHRAQGQLGIRGATRIIAQGQQLAVIAEVQHRDLFRCRVPEQRRKQAPGLVGRTYAGGEGRNVHGPQAFATARQPLR